MGEVLKSQVVFDFVGASSSATLFFGSRNFGTKRTRSACNAFIRCPCVVVDGIGEARAVGRHKMCGPKMGFADHLTVFKAKFPGGKTSDKEKKGGWLREGWHDTATSCPVAPRKEADTEGLKLSFLESPFSPLLVHWFWWSYLLNYLEAIAFPHRSKPNFLLRRNSVELSLISSVGWHQWIS